MKTLIYYSLQDKDNDRDPKETNFESGFKEIANALAIQIAYGKSSEFYNQNIVYVCGFDKKNNDLELPVFVGNENILNDMVYICQNEMYDLLFDSIFVQEYRSYETAYEVALMMKESSMMCYKADEIE